MGCHLGLHLRGIDDAVGVHVEVDDGRILALPQPVGRVEHGVMLHRGDEHAPRAVASRGA